MDATLVAFLLDLAVKLSGLPSMPAEELPQFRAVSRSQMEAQVCPEAEHGCRGIIALFDTDRYEILYLDTLDLEKASDNSFLLHEIVHALQFRQRGDAIYANCDELLRTEGQAYRAQNAYLRREGEFMRVGDILRFTTCARDRALAAHPASTSED